MSQDSYEIVMRSTGSVDVVVATTRSCASHSSLPSSKILISSPADPNAPATPVGNTYSNVYLCQLNSESFLWNFDTTTSILTAQWVNSDLYRSSHFKSYLQLVGDMVSFALAHPNAGSVQLKLLRTCDSSYSDSVPTLSVNMSLEAIEVCESVAVEANSSYQSTISKSYDLFSASN
ncbi:uncharacterized protein LACBIDRAFT_333784 [Laccaria bicolor S238N-H82]|uniref:Predicted protein n=1 Tax=Laccaria bicolor (strain S238N-H82 / ATCC MYA-4686) TaxID=486041 RepID=B0DX31_LACBS|nr:uncharacterized protein LACBIDRAFT_333784 [Laccaria bicolor S238N-H82]EDR00923.1 predicted protein [Laccaria bicolor S238N-H82]|eukprot:XP_001888517.1 predicted protein [Laccaria bicolor S238N-H82]